MFLAPPLRSALNGCGLMLLLCAPLALAQTAPSPFHKDDFLWVPLRAHLLTAPGDSPLRTTLTEADVERLLPDLNRIWMPAGIHFYLESCRTEPALPGSVPSHPAKGTLTWVWSHLPTETRATNAFNLYFVHQFAVNGVCLPQGIIIKDTVNLRPVAGGLSQPLPRVIAHELGHALSLLHRQKYSNLMASGTTGSSLNSAEIQQARFAAARYDWIQSAAAWRKQADKLQHAGQTEAAEAIYARLARMPSAAGAGVQLGKPFNE